MKSTELQANEFGAYYTHYINLSGDLDLLNSLEASYEEVMSFFNDITEAQSIYSYAEGKWTIKELLQHIIDVERIFAYRALRFAREDKTILPGFEHNDYVDVSYANNRSLKSLIKEYQTQRLSTIAMFSSFTTKMLLQIGNANNLPLSVRAIGFIVVGHEVHHCNIIKERYLAS